MLCRKSVLSNQLASDYLKTNFVMLLLLVLQFLVVLVLGPATENKSCLRTLPREIYYIIFFFLKVLYLVNSVLYMRNEREREELLFTVGRVHRAHIGLPR